MAVAQLPSLRDCNQRAEADAARMSRARRVRVLGITSRRRPIRLEDAQLRWRCRQAMAVQADHDAIAQHTLIGQAG